MVPDTFPSLFQGYLVVWLLLLGYVLCLGLRLRKIEKKLEALKPQDPEVE